MTRGWAAAAASAAVYAGVAAVFGREVLARLRTAVAADEGDPLFVAAILHWNATTLPLSERWWQLPIFAPTRDALAFSEHFLGLSVLATPVHWITGDALATYNLVALLTFPLSGLAMFALVRRLTGSAPAAFLAGLAFAFAPYRLAQLSHLQMLASFWAPLALLGLHAYLESGRRRWLALYGAGWALQAASNSYMLVFFSVLVAFWVSWFVVARGRWSALAAVAAATLAAALPLVPIVATYLSVHALHGFGREAAEVRIYSADLAAILCAPAHLTFWGWLRAGCRPEGELFPGIAVAVMAIVTAFRCAAMPAPRTRWSRPLTFASSVLIATGIVAAVVACSVLVGGRLVIDAGPLRITASSIAKPVMLSVGTFLLGLLLSPGIRGAVRGASAPGFYLVAALLMWALALGPTVLFMGEPRGIDAPFGWLMQLPGVAGLRVPARFWLLAVLCLAVLIGFLAAALLAGRRRAVVAAGLVAGSALILTDAWIDRIPAAAVNASVPDARRLQQAAVLALPMGILRDIAAEFRAVTGGWRSVNGYSGFAPSYYPALLDAARDEEDAAVAPFAERGPLHVVVDEDARRLRDLVERQPGAAVVARGAGAVQYRVPQRAPAHRWDRVGARLPIAALSASCETLNVGRAADGDERTRWECGPHRRGDDFTIDLGRPASIGAVVQNLADYHTNYPRHLVLQTSVDGTAWEAAWDGSVRGLLIAQALERPGPSLRFAVPFPPRRARYVRLRQIAEQPLPWTIAEIEVWSAR